MRPLLAQDSESGGVSQTRWAPVLAQHLCRGSKEVALVIFKCLEPLIETSEAVAPATPRPLGMCPGVELGRSPREDPPALCLGALTVTCWAQVSLTLSLSPPVTGTAVQRWGQAPPGWDTGHSSPHLEGRTPYIWNLTTSGAGGRQVFHFSSRCLARLLRKKGVERVHRDEPEIPQQKTARGGHTEGGLGAAHPVAQAG